MADTLPFNSIDHDRRYKAEDWAWYFATFLANGVFPKPSDGLQVIAYENMEIRVNKGYAFINGTAFRNPASKSIKLATAEGTLNRIDRIVVRWDLTARDTYLAILKGIPSAKPAATALTRNTECWELAIADIYVGKGVTAIRTANITDQRFNSSVCGIVKGTVDEIDASVLTKQFDDFFSIYSSEILEKYKIYIDNMGQYLENLQESGDRQMEEIVQRGKEKYKEFDTEITKYVNMLKIKGNEDLAEITQELLDFKNTNEAAFLAWFEAIKGLLGQYEAGELANIINTLVLRLDDMEEMIFTGMASAKLIIDDEGNYLATEAGVAILADWQICQCGC